MEWPPPYKIKRHHLAKHVKLKMIHSSGLEIVVPPRFSIKKIPSILEEHKAWITQHLSRLPEPQKNHFPEQVIFHALQETWRIKLLACDARLEMMIRPDREIVFVGDIKDPQLCKPKLMNWIKKSANDFLLTQLNEVSIKTGLAYTNLSVRNQKTVWGSCTLNKSISLNYKLIFLPLRLVQYVLVHELCHTKHLNHSEKFWDLVSQFDGDWRRHKQELRHADSYIPQWL